MQRYRYEFADLEFDELTRLLWRDGKETLLAPIPAKLLAALLRHAGEVVTEKELREEIWNARFLGVNVLNAAITKLRTAIGSKAAEQIVSVAKVGFKFDGYIRRFAIGSEDSVELDLRVGQAIPGKDGYYLQRPLGKSGCVWLAVERVSGIERVFKFGDEKRLGALKREFALGHVLYTLLGKRSDIVGISDANLESAPFFLAFEYGGLDLLTWAVADDDPLDKLSEAQRIELFLKTALAVSAAHSASVLHRDLKPANILISEVDGVLQPRLIDFGSGRDLVPGRMREFGLALIGKLATLQIDVDALQGTPLYLAPELLQDQAASKQSDIYALGVILYQLLVGDLKRPLSTGWQRDIDDAVLQKDISAATERRLEDRLESADELIERITHVEDRRHQHVAKSDTQQSSAVSSALNQARSAKAFAEQEAARASAINAFMAEDLIGGISLNQIGEGATISVRDVLSGALERATARFRDQPATEAEIRLQVGRMYYRLGMFKESVVQSERAIVLLEPLETVPAALRLLLKARLRLAIGLAEGARMAEAWQLIDRVRQRLDSDVSADSDLNRYLYLAQFKALFMEERYHEAVVIAQMLVNISAHMPTDQIRSEFSARYFLAAALYRSLAVEEAEREYQVLLLPPFTVDVMGEAEHAKIRIRLAEVWLYLGRFDCIKNTVESARATLEHLLGPDDGDSGGSSAVMATYFEELGDWDASLASYADALKNIVASAGAESMPARLWALDMAAVRLNRGDVIEALEVFEANREWLSERIGGDRSASFHLFEFHRARALVELNRAHEAVPVLGRIDPARMAASAPRRYWWQWLEAERARALLRSTVGNDARESLSTALYQLREVGAPGWLQEIYRRELEQ